VSAALSTVAAAMFAGHWFLGLRLDSGGRCAAADFPTCVDQGRRLEAVAILSGPAVLLAVALVIYLVRPVLERRRRVIVGVTLPAEAPLRHDVEAFASATGLRRAPLIEVGKAQEPFVYGAWPPYRLVVPVASTLNAVNRAPRDLALLAHEIGHARAGDATRYGAVIACWYASILVVVAPLAIDAWRIAQSVGVAAPQLTWRLVVVTAMLLLAVISANRAREFEADARAFQDEPAARVPIGPDRTPALVAAIGSGQHNWLRFAPSPDRRLAALADPVRRTQPAFHDAAAAGIAAGLLGTELSLLVELAFPVNVWPAYLTAALLTAVPAVGALGLPAGLPRPRVAALGLLFGSGLLIGTQLAPRASADWWRAFPAAGGRAAQMNLFAATPATAALVAVTALLIGLAVTAWAAALARHRALIWLVGVPLLAVPLATWLLALRLAAGSRWPPGAIAGVLLTPARQVPLIAVATVAAICAILRHHQVTPSLVVPAQPPGARQVLAVSALWLLTVLAVVLHPSSEQAVQDLRASAPRWDSVPPPATTNAAYACFWVNHLGPEGLPGAEEVTGLGQVGAYLSTVDDPTLRQAGTSLAGPGRAGITDWRQAAATLDLVMTRCDSLLSALDQPLPKDTK
jgi:hypothetical protein